jgi:hypothetical protein
MEELAVNVLLAINLIVSKDGVEEEGSETLRIQGL